MSVPEETNPGEIFRTTREKLGLSINDISVATKINARVLKALEAGDKASLPPSSFSRGFIRTYATYLKIEAQPILNAFNLIDTSLSANSTSTNQQETSPETEDSKKSVPAKSTNNPLTDPSIYSKIIMALGILLVVGLIFGVKKIVDKYAKERRLAPNPTVIEQPLDTPTEANTTNIHTAENTEKQSDSTKTPDTAKATEAAPVAATDKNKNVTAVTPTSATPQVPPAQPKAPTAVLKSTTTATTPAPVATPPTPTPSPAPPAPAIVKAPTPPVPVKVVAPKPIEAKVDTKAETKAPTTPPAKPIKPAAPQEVIIEALDNVVLQVSIDGAPLKKIILKPDGIQTIKAKSSIDLDIQDGGMVNIIHNGQEKGIPGDLGKPVKIKFP